MTGPASFVGWSGVAEVVVAWEDVGAAWRIAVEFDETVATASDTSTEEAANAEPSVSDSETWPECPECGARRVTRCPICGTDGDRLHRGRSRLPRHARRGRGRHGHVVRLRSGGCSSGGSASAESGAGCGTEQQGIPISGPGRGRSGTTTLGAAPLDVDLLDVRRAVRAGARPAVCAV